MFNFPAYVASRYIFSRKSHNVINIISWISLIGVSVGTIAFIVILSVFNGFDGLIKSLISTFDPELKIVAAKGKTFSLKDGDFDKVLHWDEIEGYSKILEEQALLQYVDKQVIATVKGVDSSYTNINGVDTMMVEGSFSLRKGKHDMAVAGYGIAYRLQINLFALTPLNIYAPKRGQKSTLDPSKAFNKMGVLPSGFFSIQSEFDEKYLIVPIEFARSLFGYKEELTSIEIKTNEHLSESEIETLKEKIQTTLGDDFKVMNKYEQHALLYKIMQSEKWAIFLILAFVLLVASFNVTGSLIMLIVDKKKDISILRSLGATKEQIYRIFFIEGCIISVGGAIVGLILGVAVCFAQIQFGIISFPNSSLISAYPVELRFGDFIGVFFTVVSIGLFAAWFPVRFFTRNFVIMKG